MTRPGGTQSLDGFMPTATRKLFMEITRFEHELLYQVSLPAGLGSNPVGLDGGQLGDSAVVFFRPYRPEGVTD